MKRYVARGAVAAALAGAALVGCGEQQESASRNPSPAAGSTSGTSTAGTSPAPGRTAVTKDGRVGAPGTVCVMPVSFEPAPDWKPKPVPRLAADSPLASWTKHGPFDLACEIDAKPAGHLGYLRAWVQNSSTGMPRAALESFVGADRTASRATYRETKAGSLPAAEVVYETYSKLLDESKQEHALAVVTPRGTLVLHLGGLDTQEHQDMLPAYELAKRSMRLAS
ncbi:lipoprotein [Streptomyces sp. NPDC001251]|uniref:lipoprotein n=1 Tax=Streptomyces TaxID=1883 RepID=UPI00131AC6A0|nr:lipoprotein [Streptomyces sp. CB01201]